MIQSFFWMKRISILLISLWIMALGTKAQSLQVGDRIPNFTLKDQQGEDFSISSVLGKRILVIYFYPKDDTPGCTKEACSFRDSYEAFTDEGAMVIGISADDVETHRQFAEKYRLPFTLLADTGNKVRKKFGVPGNLFGLIAGRVTYVVDNRGIIRHIYNSQVNASQHIDESLEALRKVKKEDGNE